MGIVLTRMASDGGGVFAGLDKEVCVKDMGSNVAVQTNARNESAYHSDVAVSE